MIDRIYDSGGHLQPGARPYHFSIAPKQVLLSHPSLRLTYAAAYQMLATNQPPEDIVDYLQYQLNRHHRHA